jgi:hypothetical protein
MSGSDRGPRMAAYSIVRSSRAFAALAIAVACAANYADPDLWLHVLVGQRIVHTGLIPMRDLYSYSALGMPWHNHEWLSQLVLGLSYQWLGVIGLKLVKLSCAAILVAALSVGLSRTGAPPSVQRIVLLATAAALIPQMQFGPQLFTFAMLAILMAKLAAEIYRGPARLSPLIPMFAVWANFHAGFVVGLAALGIATVVLAVDDWRAGRSKLRVARMAAATLGCAAATLINPFGIDVWSTFLQALSDPMIRPFIIDWQPLTTFLISVAHSAGGQVMQGLVPLLLFAFLTGSILMAPATDDAPLVIIAFVLIAAAFYANRNMALAVIAVCIPLAHHAGIAVRKRRSVDDLIEAAAPNPLLLVVAAAMFILIGGELSNRLKTWEPLPGGALAFMKAHHLRGSILNHLDWGEYLIWHLSPQSAIFMDGRYELVYPDALLKEYLQFHFGQPQGARVLERYPHDFVLVKPESGAYRLTAANPGWKIVYRDPVAVLFARAKSPLAAVRTKDDVALRHEASEFP